MSFKTRRPILLVEDDFVLRTSLAELLTQEGYDVECAAHGLEAYHWLNSANTRPSLIVLDLMMPYMDGIEFRDLQKALPSVADVPVVVITASAEPAAAATGVDPKQTFFKPANTPPISQTIRRLTPPAPPQP